MDARLQSHRNNKKRGANALLFTYILDIIFM